MGMLLSSIRKRVPYDRKNNALILSLEMRASPLELIQGQVGDSLV